MIDSSVERKTQSYARKAREGGRDVRFWWRRRWMYPDTIPTCDSQYGSRVKSSHKYLLLRSLVNNLVVGRHHV